MNKWISVKDKYPKISDIVLTYTNTGKYEVMMFTGGISGKNNLISKWFSENGLEYTNVYYTSSFLFECITHWKPLPDPPDKINKE